jgi:hypothetical protein
MIIPPLYPQQPITIQIENSINLKVSDREKLQDNLKKYLEQ